MRKIDYQHLADAIRAYLESASAQRHANPEFSAGAIAASKGIANQFAANASVNRDEFLRQCGVVKGE
jgi:hypothetical protein